ncbi:type II toxin-antitoxin system Phd/YefM family antitoxin [Nonomuraea sp. NPDC052129]|uniref:type II toxin-antitoxin system Phd/YefM family antitoxin n=1 Tax=Nonomuraea sp. NPDC052129 TaxID=3154651 RepID=UPI0034122B7B
MRIYKMRDLNQRTAEVIQEINDSGEPAIITRHGRFVALISPLLNKGLEGELIARYLEREAKESGQEPNQVDNDVEVGDQLTEDLARRLGIDWP